MADIRDCTPEAIDLSYDEAVEILLAFRRLSKADKFKIIYIIKGAILASEPIAE